MTTVTPHRTFLRWSALGMLTLLAACGQTQNARVPAGVAASTPLAAQAVAGAAFTTVNPMQVLIGGDTSRCVNGQDSAGGTVNRNIYTRKDYVWINGGPIRTGPSALSTGTYFFAVLEPSGQNNPNDGGDHVLSDTNTLGGSGSTGGGDSYTNRMFTVSGGDIATYAGTHATAMPGTGQGKMIQAVPFDDTSNPGGVYIMALCKITPETYDPVTHPARPQDCKYDAFKVRTADPVTPPVAAELSGFKYNDYNRNGIRDLGEPALAGWNIHLVCAGYGAVDTTVTTDANGYWRYAFPSHASTPQGTSCTATEVMSAAQAASWRQTGNTDDQSSATGATVALTDKIYTVTIDTATDALITELNFGNIPQGTVSGLKYLDFLNKVSNGRYDAGEPGIQGWTITSTSTGPGAAGAATPVMTGPDGTFTVTLDPGTYTFAEVQKSGWTQTGNTVTQVSPSGAATLMAKVYTVTVDRDAPATISGINFGNVPLGKITGSKLYGETGNPVGGWQVKLTGTDSLGRAVGPLTTYTASEGTYAFGDLLPGTYRVTESLPNNNTKWAYWAAVSSTVYTVALDGVTTSGTTAATAPAFRNACYRHPGGRTMGFWSNNNGQALINNATDLAALRALNLRGASGSPFDPTTYTSYRSWLLSAAATNAAYMTSAQLSATRNNITHMLNGAYITNPTFVVNPATGQTVQDLVTYANSLLADPNGYTVVSSPMRTEQLRVKDLLDKINNDGDLGGFMQSSSASCPTATFNP